MIESLIENVNQVYSRCAYQEKKIEALKEQCDRLERRCIEQAKDFENQLKAIKELIFELEKKVNENVKPVTGKSAEPGVPLSQVMDEWLNGERKSDK